MRYRGLSLFLSLASLAIAGAIQASEGAPDGILPRTATTYRVVDYFPNYVSFHFQCPLLNWSGLTYCFC